MCVPVTSKSVPRGEVPWYCTVPVSGPVSSPHSIVAVVPEANSAGLSMNSGSVKVATTVPLGVFAGKAGPAYPHRRRFGEEGRGVGDGDARRDRGIPLGAHVDRERELGIRLAVRFVVDMGPDDVERGVSRSRGHRPPG